MGSDLKFGNPDLKTHRLRSLGLGGLGCSEVYGFKGFRGLVLVPSSLASSRLGPKRKLW